jgi:hypothetical protein
MIAELPQDVQGHVWEIYTTGLRSRMERPRQVAEQVLEQIGALCNGDATTLLDWMASMLQHPAVKPRKAIVLAGRESSGKDNLIALLTRLVPTLHTREPRLHVYGRWNALMEQARLVVIEDADQNRNMAALKSLISDETVAVHPDRGQPMRVIHSTHRVLLTVDSVQPSLSHRRFDVIHCTDEFMKTAQHSDVLRELCTTSALDELRKLLLDRRVEGQM